MSSGQNIYVTEKEFHSLSEAQDFISTNIDGADKPEEFQEVIENLHNMFLKYKRRRDR